MQVSHIDATQPFATLDGSTIRSGGHDDTVLTGR
jgi:hypothetical protein